MAAGPLYKSFFWKSLQLGSSILVNILFARLLRSALTAEFYSLVYLFSLFSGFFTLGLDIGLNYFITRRELSTAAARKIAVVIMATALPLSIGLLYAVHPFPGTTFAPSVLLLFGGCQIAGTLLTTFAGAILTARGRNHVPAILALAANLLLLAYIGVSYYTGTGYFIRTGHYTGSGYLLLPRHEAVQALCGLYFFLSLAQGLALFWLTGRRHSSQPATPGTSRATSVTSAATITRLFHYCLLIFITNFIFFVGGRVAIYLLPYFVPQNAMGNYIQAYKLVEYLTVVVAFLYYPFITLVAGEERGQIDQKVLLLVRLSNTVVTGVAIGGALLGNWLFPLVFGGSFEGIYRVFLWLIPGMYAACSSTFLTAWFYGAGKIRYNLISACIQIGTALLLFFLLTPVWGTEGAAMAFSGAAVCSMGYDALVFRRFYRYAYMELGLLRRSDWHFIARFARKILPL